MLNLQDLKVHIFNTDIAAMVLSMTMYETIKGSVRASMTIKDGVNFMDTFITKYQAPLRIEWQYMSYLWTNHFYTNGIERVELDKDSKQYTIHFISYTTVNESTIRINETFSGRGDQIISDIFKQANGNFSAAPLRIESKCENKGRYVVPNITARTALNNVLNASFDTEKTPMCLYQRVCDEGGTRLASLDFMDNNKFYRVEYSGINEYHDTFELRAANAGASNDSDGLNSMETVGTVAKFTIEEHHKDFISKLGSGYYGHKVQHIQLDKTATEDFPPQEATEIPLTVHKLPEKMYDNNVVSIFGLACTPEGIAINNIKKKVFNTRIKAEDVIAIPGLGCGFCIKIASGESNLNYSKMDSNYIISDIHHKFNMNDGEFTYLQDIGLIRDE